MENSCPRNYAIIAVFLCLLPARSAQAESYQPVQVPESIDHTVYDTLLRTYVNNSGLVDYGTWKDNRVDTDALRLYTEGFASAQYGIAEGAEAVASLINLYNALTLQSILEVYPVASIREIDGVWSKRRFIVSGIHVSIDDVEHGTLRPLIGWKVHAAVVCAARSCPPLQPFAYKAESLDETLDAVNRKWMHRIDMNRFSPPDRIAEISKIFDWYERDFESIGGVRAFLKTYAPQRHRIFVGDAATRIRFMSYHWGLNDQSDLGKNYRRSLF